MAERGGLLHPEVEDYTPKQAQDEVARGALLIDVREQHEWDAGRMPDAQLIPMGHIPSRLGDLPATARSSSPVAPVTAAARSRIT